MASDACCAGRVPACPGTFCGGMITDVVTLFHDMGLMGKDDTSNPLKSLDFLRMPGTGKALDLLIAGQINVNMTSKPLYLFNEWGRFIFLQGAEQAASPLPTG